MLAYPPSHVVALLMAGGSGTRLWPISRRGRAKQFSPLLGETTLLEMTYARVRAFLPDARIFVNVTAGNESWVHRLLPELPLANVIAAPDDRDTLPTLGYATLAVERLVPSPTMLLLASDNWIGEVGPLHDALFDAIDAAERGPHLVSVGIRPTHASTQYGYMHMGERAPFGAACYFGRGYHEKPSSDVAQRFFEGGVHDWNSGMFAWTARTFWDALRAFAPTDAEVFDELRERGPAMSPDEVRASYARLRKIAVDHGILEHVGPLTREKHVFVRAATAWDDVGHYAALAPHLPEDDHGNRVRGDVSAYGSRGCTLVCDATTRLEVHGLRDLIVVSDSGDLLVAAAASYGRVRELAERDLWPGDEATGSAYDEDGNRLHGFVKVVGARDCRVDAEFDGVVALLDVEGLEVRAEPGRIVVWRRASAVSEASAVANGKRPSRIALTVAEDEERMSLVAAAHCARSVATLLAAKASPVIMFSAGRTPAGLFRLLRSVHRSSVDWSRVKVAQMDEYVGVRDSETFGHALQTQLIEPLGVQRFARLDGAFSAAELLAYEERLLDEGLDLVVHGIGSNGHLGFNEPGTPFDACAHIATLAPETRQRISWTFADEAVPHRGLTLGLSSLNRAREVLLIACGEHKADAIHDALFGPVVAHMPASSLQLHPNVSVIVDRHAARRCVERPREATVAA